jgi:hypothetical protein
MVISSSSDETVRVWDLATGDPVGRPYISPGGAVKAVTSQIRRGLTPKGRLAYVGLGATNIAIISAIRREDDGSLRWEQIVATEVNSNILSLALTSKPILAVATELGIVALDLAAARGLFG